MRYEIYASDMPRFYNSILISHHQIGICQHEKDTQNCITFGIHLITRRKYVFFHTWNDWTYYTTTTTTSETQIYVQNMEKIC